MIVDLADLKLHLRVDGDEENSLITAYGQAAEARVRDWIGRPFYRSADDLPAPGSAEYDPYQIVADQRIRVAIMQLVGLMFGPNRSGQGAPADDAVPPQTVRDLLSGLRVFFIETETEVRDGD